MGRLIIAVTDGSRVHVAHGTGRAIIDVAITRWAERHPSRTTLYLRCSGGLTVGGRLGGELPMKLEDEILIMHANERCRMQLWHRAAGTALAFDGPLSFAVLRDGLQPHTQKRKREEAKA